MKRLAKWFALAVVVALVAVWFVHGRLSTPYRGFTGDEVFVELPSGVGVSGIAARLAEAGVIPDSWTFRLAARLSHDDRKLKAGEYRFAAAATPAEVVARLAKGDVFTRSVTFPEGETVRDMAATFEKAGLGTAAEFTEAARDASLVMSIDPDAASLEGYLFPDTYALPRSAGAAGTVQAMVTRFEQSFGADLRAAAVARRMSPREVVTLASLIEKETASPAERPIVSAVYHNRLERGMALQCDPTVIYALMLARRWNGNIRKDDLQIDSPYNTYRYPGLPPGPIAAPGRASLDAAVHPAEVPYLYFVSKNDGTHAFAATLAEHQRNVQRWQIKYFSRGRTGGNE